MKIDSLIEKFFLVALLFQVFSSIALNAQDENTSNSTVEQDGVKFYVEHAKSYPDAMELKMKQVVKNNSDHIIGIALATDVYDLRISLTDPNGKIVKPYPYFYNFKRYFAVTIAPGNQEEVEFSLANYFPFGQVGEYRCSVTRLVYDHVISQTRSFAPERTGVPVELTAPEIRFTLESPKHIERRTTEDDAHHWPRNDVLDYITNRHNQRSFTVDGKEVNLRDSVEDRSSDSSSEDIAANIQNKRTGLAKKASAPESASHLWAWLLLGVSAAILAWMGIRFRRKQRSKHRA